MYQIDDQTALELNAESHLRRNDFGQQVLSNLFYRSQRDRIPQPRVITRNACNPGYTTIRQISTLKGLHIKDRCETLQGLKKCGSHEPGVFREARNYPGLWSVIPGIIDQVRGPKHFRSPAGANSWSFAFEISLLFGARTGDLF